MTRSSAEERAVLARGAAEGRGEGGWRWGKTAAKGPILAFTPAKLWAQWKILFSTTSHCDSACAVRFGSEDAIAPLLGKRPVY